MGKTISIILAIIVVALGIVGASSLFTVDERQQAMVMRFGKVDKIITEPGLQYKIPFVQNVIFVEKRVLAVNASRSEVVTKDQKRLLVDAFSRFRISDPLLFYQSFGDLRVASSRIGTLLSSRVRQVLATQILTDIVSGERSRLMDEIKNQVNVEVERRGLQVVDVRIVRADLPNENSQKVFDRMRTEREQEAKQLRAEGAEIAQRIRANAERERTVLIANAKKDAEILRGTGDAEKNRIFAAAFGQDPDFFAFYRSMQAYREAISDDDTTMILSPDSDFFRYFGSQGKAGN
ncbi:protease modulator HflC [Sneathiella sp. P13V-1]|uniref:protease modulator HflC n=1 Tax=Sneathiella sp. P13V-1 TaxID=2697366 RepID=UPI00187B6BE4|nr:protease modulator HflC [Sneathiella sp. P13V-1]MBE7637890.1 protease modulator HflC [Sneathiella sp. P13V-1]